MSGIKSGIQYYEGKLYYLHNNASGQLMLSRMDGDGTNLENVAVISESFQSAGGGLNFRIDGNYVFVIGEKAFEGDTIQILYGKNISDSSEIEMIYEAKYVAELINLPQVKDNKAYFTTDYIGYENEQLITYGNLNAFDFETRENTVLAENADGSFVLQEEQVFYGNHNGEIHTMNLTTLESTLLHTVNKNDRYFYMSVDETYIYVDNAPATMSIHPDGEKARCIYVYSHSGELVDTVLIEENDFDCINLVGDNSNLVLYSSSQIEFFDKQQIGTGQYQWERIELDN